MTVSRPARKMATASFKMILHDKCGPFELLIIELEGKLLEKEKIINDLQSHIDYLEERLEAANIIKEDSDGKNN
jgi:hypothetical protein